MLTLHLRTLLTLFAATVTCAPTPFLKRQSNEISSSSSSTVVFRTDLKSVNMGQPDRFKNLILTTVPSANSNGAYEISFINTCQTDLASGGIILPQNLPLTTNTITGQVSTTYMNAATAGDPKGPQPVTLSTTEQENGLGELYEDGGELKLRGVSPEWDTWILCPGETHPELKWLGIVGGRVRIPGECSAVRVFRMRFEELVRSVEGRC